MNKATVKIETFSTKVNQLLEKRGYKQTDLVNKTTLTKTTVSRICRDNNDKGSTYLPSPRVIWAICYGLRLSKEETKELFMAAFPELKILLENVGSGKGIDEINEELTFFGYTLLTNSEE